jgi:hypothetical protein
VTSDLATCVSHRSSEFLRVIRLIDFATQLTAVLHAGSLDSYHNILTLPLFNNQSNPGRSLFVSENVTIFVDFLYAEAIEAVNSRGALLASTTMLIPNCGVLILRHGFETVPSL